MVKMCPERQMISLYLDGELSSPWKEKMEAHLEACPACRAVLASYRRLGTGSAALSGGAVSAAGERVWEKLLEQSPELAEAEFTPLRRTRPVSRIWNRSITLPLPAVAAAAVLVIVVFLAVSAMGGRSQPLPAESMAVIGLDDWGIVPVQQDMSEVMRYLAGQDSGDFMVIRLPESRTFSQTGEPALINAADYSRRGMRR